MLRGFAAQGVTGFEVLVQASMFSTILELGFEVLEPGFEVLGPGFDGFAQKHRKTHTTLQLRFCSFVPTKWEAVCSA